MKSDSVAEAINKSGGSAASFPGDVTNPTFPDDILAFTVKYVLTLTDGINWNSRHFGKVNIIVNNAGFTWDGVIHKTTDKQWVRKFPI